eukprot:scaffold323776_cov18-Tisochrysis_lutea.AAC.1
MLQEGRWVHGAIRQEVWHQPHRAAWKALGQVGVQVGRCTLALLLPAVGQRARLRAWRGLCGAGSEARHGLRGAGGLCGLECGPWRAARLRHGLQELRWDCAAGTAATAPAEAAGAMLLACSCGRMLLCRGPASGEVLGEIEATR